MLALPLRPVPAPVASTATFAAAALHALAREEASGRRPKRFLEPSHATWQRFRGRLGPIDLLELLLEDAAVTQPAGFDAATLLGAEAKLAELPEPLVTAWLDSLPSLSLTAPSPDYVAAQAKLLGLPTRLAKADLHKVKPHHRVLEVPGTGGQLAHHLVQSNPEVYFRDVFTVACGSWQERALAGLVAVECGASGELPILFDPKLEAARGRGPFDFVVGLDPDKGGFFAKPALETWFPHATVLLV